jgi:hypothetical protein
MTTLMHSLFPDPTHKTTSDNEPNPFLWISEFTFWIGKIFENIVSKFYDIVVNSNNFGSFFFVLTGLFYGLFANNFQQVSKNSILFLFIFSIVSSVYDQNNSIVKKLEAKLEAFIQQRFDLAKLINDYLFQISLKNESFVAILFISICLTFLVLYVISTFTFFSYIFMLCGVFLFFFKNNAITYIPEVDRELQCAIFSIATCFVFHFVKKYIMSVFLSLLFSFIGSLILFLICVKFSTDPTEYKKTFIAISQLKASIFSGNGSLLIIGSTILFFVAQRYFTFMK